MAFFKKLIRKVKGFLMNRYLFRFQHNAYLLIFKNDLLKWQPDLIHCNDWQTLSLGAFAKSQMGSKLIFDSHELETHRNPPLPENRKRWMERYEQLYLSQCDFVTTVCAPISDYLKKQYGIDQPIIIYNAPIHPNSYKGHRDWGRLPDNCNVRKEAKLSKDDFLLVSVGNATVNRGLENVIEALTDLPRDINLAIVGRVTSQFRELLDSLVEQYGLKERVHFIQPVNPTVVVDFISSADVGIISLIPATLSYNYALPNKLFECAFADLPIIASDTQEVKRKMIDYKLGEVYASGNIIELRAAIAKIYNASKLSENQKHIHERFIQDHNFEKSVESLLNRLTLD